MQLPSARWTSATVLVLAAASSPVRADPYTLAYTATVTSAMGPQTPAVGSAVTGSFVLDTDASAYTPEMLQQWTATTALYSLMGPPYQATLQASPWSVAAGLVTVQVFDNDLSALGISEPGDAIFLGGKYQGLSFSILVYGRADAFSGVAPPQAGVLASFWTSGRFSASDGGFTNQAVATVQTLSVSAVPEPPAGLLALPGLAGLAALHLARRRRR